MSPLTFLSAFVFAMLVVGVLNRRRKRLHIMLMVTALAIDLWMVVYLEFMRGVVESIPARPKTPLLIVHICLSTVVLVLYGVQVVGGISNARGRRSRTHRKVAIWFLAARFGNLLTSIWVV